jgi:hypothetical protein
MTREYCSQAVALPRLMALIVSSFAALALFSLANDLLAR